MNLSSKRIFQHWISAKIFQRKLKWSNQTQGRIVIILTNRGNSWCFEIPQTFFPDLLQVLILYIEIAK